jgi:MHS family alpha-ketoglutarate permease-like MFS transporter
METHKNRLPSIIGGSIGNLVEWYDWYAYSAFTLYFAKVFFPQGDKTAQLLNAAAVFAVGFLMRPIGGWLLGRYADRHGRRAALTLSVLAMGAGSLIIAVTPGFKTIGVLAPLLLLVARLIQGLSVGGEYGASATYLSEMAGQRWRGFYSSFQYVTLIMGQLIALGVLIALQTWLLTPQELDAFGWRIAFGVGAVLALAALFIRRHIAETTAFERLNEHPRDHRGQVAALLRQHPWQVLQVVGLTLGGTVAFYTYTTYMQKFLVNSAGWSKPEATVMSAGTLLLYTLLQPAVGALSDKIGRKPLLIAFGVMGTLCTVPIMTALGHAKPGPGAFLLIMAALLIVSGYTAINAVVKAELFPASLRALGVALPYGIAVSLFGGTAEYIALAAKQAGHEAWFFWYVSACAFVSLLVYVFTADSRKSSAFAAEES